MSLICAYLIFIVRDTLICENTDGVAGGAEANFSPRVGPRKVI